MKFKDLLWFFITFIFILILIFDKSRNEFIMLTKAHPYLMGFIKTSILATMGELLAFRIFTGNYKGILGIKYKFIIWGLIGVSFAFVFPLFSEGTKALQEANLLPNVSREIFAGKLLNAFFTSLIMNLIFAPTFMAFHRITDTYIELGEGKVKTILNIKIDDVIEKIDWHRYIKFVLLKTIPLFWIPAHTITFLLPSEYRILSAAFLSIALGVILSYSKKKRLI